MNAPIEPVDSVCVLRWFSLPTNTRSCSKGAVSSGVLDWTGNGLWDVDRGWITRGLNHVRFFMEIITARSNAL